MYVTFLTTDASQHAITGMWSLPVFITPQRLGKANKLDAAQGYHTLNISGHIPRVHLKVTTVYTITHG